MKWLCLVAIALGVLYCANGQDCPAEWGEWSNWVDIPNNIDEKQTRTRTRGEPCPGGETEHFQPACPQNILITVDTSSSVSRRRFVQLREGVTLMLRHADIQPPFTHIGLCYFGTTATAIISLAQFNDHATVNDLIDTSTTLSGRTKVSLGLQCLHEEWLLGRSDVHDVCVLVIDGNPSDPPNDAEELAATRQWVDTLKTVTCDEFVIFAIGNAFTDIDEIESWKDPLTSNNYFHTPSFEQFRAFFEEENAFPTFCPIDGEWAQWSAWGDCSVSCDGGSRSSSRRCADPIPSQGGADCNAADGLDRAEGCNPDPCPRNGAWSPWTPWQACSEPCGGGTRSRGRACDNPTAIFGGLDCPGAAGDGETCNTDPCPVNGEWSQWNQWGGCSVSCGDGTRFRDRRCDSPEPEFGGLDCPGSAGDSGDCNDGPCPGNGAWSPWAQWGGCSETCGDGTRFRDRLCDSPPPTFGGEECPGSDGDNGACNDADCPVNGNWSPWDQWGACTRSCGGGTRRRTRECDNPPPLNGGRDCPGSSDDSGPCNTPACPTEPPVISDCDECIIINGIGYKDIDTCWNYLQCYFDENGQVVRAIRRTTAWGAYWNQYDINQDFPWNTDCQFEPCRNQEASFRHGRSDNCRGYWQCGINGRSAGLFCCDEGMRFDPVSQECVVDGACLDSCPPILPTSEGPLPCPLRLREGTDNRFYNELDPGVEDMFCADTQIFDESLCTCINLIHDGCLPEVWIDFRDGVIADVSRNKYFIDVHGGVTIGVENNGDYFGSFSSAGETQLIIDGMASIDPGEKLAVYVRYRRNTNENFPNGAARPAILSNSDCLPLDYSYAAYINPSSSGGTAAGWVRSESSSEERTNTNENGGINEYIMEYQGDRTGQTLMLSINDGSAVGTTEDGPRGRVRQNSCALHIAYGQRADNFAYFDGDIHEVRVYRCIPASYTPAAAAGLG